MTYEAEGKFVTQPNQISYKCYGDAGYTDVHVTLGTVVTIIGTKTPTPVTITISNPLNDILLGGTANSSFDKTPALMNALNYGETFTGTITNNGTLTLKSTTSTTTATGKFVTKANQISYRCDGSGYINIPVISGATITIIGTSVLPTIPYFNLDTRNPAGFTEFIIVGLVAATGEPAKPVGNLVNFLNELSIISTVYGKCSNNGSTGPNGSQVTFYYDIRCQQPIITFTSTKTVAWIEWTTNNKINSDGKLNINIYSIAQQNGAFQLNILSSGIHQIEPFVITLDLYNKLTTTDKASVIFFSRFDAALALSNFDTPRQAAVNNATMFLPALSDCVNTIYDGNNAYTPKFNMPRRIYGQFSNTGATLQFYKDQAHITEIGTFSLQSPQNGEFISKLLWHTDARISPTATTDSRVDPTNGNVRYWVTFDKPIAQSNGKIIIELINPNDSAYQALLNITDFTNLTFADTNNNKITFDQQTTNILNNAYEYKDTDSSNRLALVKSAKDDPKDFGHNTVYSTGYHPLMIFNYLSQKITIDCHYNVLAVTCEAGYMNDCVCSYQEQSISKNYPGSTTLTNIANITANGLSPLNRLQAPIVKDQIIFYCNYGYNQNNEKVDLNTYCFKE